MSAIGNYIHLTAAGYNRTGTNRQREGPSLDAATALSLEKDFIRQRIESYKSMNDLSSLESEINNLLDVLGDRVEPSKTNWDNEVRQIIEDYLTEEYGNTLQTIDWSNLDVNFTSVKTKGVGKIKTNYWQYKNWKSTILSRINELNTYMENFSENKTTREYQDAINRINTIKNDLYKGTYDMIAKNGWNTNKQNPLKIAIKDLNEIIAKYAAMPAISAQKGDLLEATIAVIPAMTKDMLNKEIGSFIKGRDKVSVTIDENNFKDKSWNIQLGDIVQTGRTSQGKIDVAFEWEGQQLNISAKNVNLKDRNFIHIMGGSSLLYLLQDENVDFVNHYFNLFSNHPDKKGNVAGYAAMRNAYFDVLKLMIAYKALTGDSFDRGNNQADVFIVSDSSGSHSRRVKVFSIGDILQKFLERPTSNLGIANASSIQRLYANKRVENSPSGIARVAAVLNEAHARKITASFNSALLDWD